MYQYECSTWEDAEMEEMSNSTPVDPQIQARNWSSRDRSTRRFRRETQRLKKDQGQFQVEE